MDKLEKLDVSEIYRQPPPAFGHAMHQYFALDPDYVNLNHGSFGSVPLPVLAAVHDMNMEIEANPDKFHRTTYIPRLVEVRRKLAQLIGANIDECVLVANASAGVDTILRNFEWEQGDIIVTFNTTYEGVDKSVRNISDVPPHPTVSSFALRFPTTHADIIAKFTKYLHALPKVEGKKIVAIIDTIVSNPGVLLPWQEMVKICKEQGVWSIVDAAHSIGQEMNINLSQSQPDFWVSNCHKWLYAKRSCAILYVPARNQHIVKSSIPTAHAYISPVDRTEPNFVPQYEWNGTIDFASYLSVAAALDFRNWLGGEAEINTYCHEIAVKGGKRLAEIFGTKVMDPEGDLTVNMVNVELPISASIKPTQEINLKFNDLLLTKYNVYSAHFYHNDAWWTRCSVQVFTEVEDFEKLGKAWLSAIPKVLEEVGLN